MINIIRHRIASSQGREKKNGGLLCHWPLLLKCALNMITWKTRGEHELIEVLK